jgi:hypothetical protein
LPDIKAFIATVQRAVYRIDLVPPMSIPNNNSNNNNMNVNVLARPTPPATAPPQSQDLINV